VPGKPRGAEGRRARTFGSRPRQRHPSGSGQPQIAHVDSERAIDWGHVYLSEGNTIGDAVAQFNDYNDIKIVVDEETSARQMRGRFDAIDPLSFADTVGKAAQASVVRESPGLIHIKQPERHR